MARRRCWIIVMGVLAATSLAGPAHAALYLVFESDSYKPSGYQEPRTGGIGAPGELVRARTAGTGAMGQTDAMPVLLARGGYPHADSLAGLEEADGVMRVGTLRADADGTGHLAFTVPEIAPGRYELIAYCPDCAQFSSGQVILPLAPFRVTGVREGSGRAPTPPSVRPLVTVTVIALILLGAWFRLRVVRAASRRVPG